MAIVGINNQFYKYIYICAMSVSHTSLTHGWDGVYSFKTRLSNVGKPIVNPPFEDGFYHLFLVK